MENADPKKNRGRGRWSGEEKKQRKTIWLEKRKNRGRRRTDHDLVGEEEEEDEQSTGKENGRTRVLKTRVPRGFFSMSNAPPGTRVLET